jgi:hypothetical protein
MTKPSSGKRLTIFLGIVACLISAGIWGSGTEAKKSTVPLAVANAPVCETNARPKITKVAPDPVKVGDKISIKGENFGKKECFQNVSFGSTATSQFKYLNATTLEATVPNMKPGITPVNILTAAGSSQFIILLTAK